jgi:nicotinate-nucleotide adenylyltransferase
MMDQPNNFLEPDWIFFGGTFDPPHLGHMDMVSIARTNFPNAQIVIIPAFQPPRSKDAKKTVAADFGDRVAMCVLAFDGWDQVQVSILEESLPTPSYTINTLRDLRQEYPNDKFAWMVGADQLKAFTSWRDPKNILELTDLVVLPRPDQVTEDLLNLGKDVAISLGFDCKIDQTKNMVQLGCGSSIIVLKDVPVQVSSSQLRTALQSQSVSINEMVPKTVHNYIDELGLYAPKTKESDHGKQH